MKDLNKLTTESLLNRLPYKIKSSGLVDEHVLWIFKDGRDWVVNYSSVYGPYCGLDDIQCQSRSLRKAVVEVIRILNNKKRINNDPKVTSKPPISKDTGDYILENEWENLGK